MVIVWSAYSNLDLRQTKHRWDPRRRRHPGLENERLWHCYCHLQLERDYSHNPTLSLFNTKWFPLSGLRYNSYFVPTESRGRISFYFSQNVNWTTSPGTNHERDATQVTLTLGPVILTIRGHVYVAPSVAKNQSMLKYECSRGCQPRLDICREAPLLYNNVPPAPLCTCYIYPRWFGSVLTAVGVCCSPHCAASSSSPWLWPSSNHCNLIQFSCVYGQR